MSDVQQRIEDKECFRERKLKDRRFVTSYFIKDQNHFSMDFAKLFMSEEFKDVDLLSNEGEKIPAHRLILATRCSYFQSLLFGRMKEAKDDVVQMNCSTEVLKQLLKFIYVGRLNLLKCSTLEIMELLDKTRMMFMDDLHRQVHQFLCDNLMGGKIEDINGEEEEVSLRLAYSPFESDEGFTKHAIVILNESIRNSFPELMNLSIAFIKENISTVLESKWFELLSHMAINELFRLDALESCSQVKIFKAIVDWMGAKNDELDDDTKESLLKQIHLNKMSNQDLCQVVRPTALYSDSVLMDAINASLLKTQVKDVQSMGRQKLKQIPKWMTEMNFRFGRPKVDVDDENVFDAGEEEIGEEFVELTEREFNGYNESSDKDVHFDVHDATLHICLKIEGSCDTCEERDKVDEHSDSDSESEEEYFEEGTSDHLEKINIIDNHTAEEKPTLGEWQKNNAKILEREIPNFEKYLKQREAHFLNDENMDIERENSIESKTDFEGENKNSLESATTLKKRKKSSRLTKQNKIIKM